MFFCNKHQTELSLLLKSDLKLSSSRMSRHSPKDSYELTFSKFSLSNAPKEYLNICPAPFPFHCRMFHWLPPDLCASPLKDTLSEECYGPSLTDFLRSQVQLLNANTISYRHSRRNDDSVSNAGADTHHEAVGEHSKRKVDFDGYSSE